MEEVSMLTQELNMNFLWEKLWEVLPIGQLEVVFIM
jgi:hypothetical protein